MRIFARGSSGRGSNDSVVVDNGTAIFSVFASYVFGYFRDEASVITGDMQSVVGFSVIPKCMTLTGYFALNAVFTPVWLAETVRLRKLFARKLIKIDTYCQRRKSSARTLVSGKV